ncbi:MAG: tetraacyldisaccharide 4'-kinase [Bacteroidota bacterium]
MKFLKWLLFPFAVLYDAVTSFRNHLFNIGHFRSFEFQTNVISVGNLSVGGTGKTPMVEYLIRLLNESAQVATLSRGYGRKTSGFIKGEPDTTKVADIGDEPYQYLLKYGHHTDVYVGEERAWAIPAILFEKTKTDIILLDDAYQHRSVKPSLSILLTKYDNPFTDDFLLPAGRLREARKGANRADIIVVTKCPEDINQKAVSDKIGQYTDDQKPVFFTSVKYGAPVRFNGDSQPDVKSAKVMLVSGIANADDFEEYGGSQFDVIDHLRFSDHHQYKSKDIEKMKLHRVDQQVIYLTTEKDFVKLREFEKELADLPFYYLPIEIVFKDNKSEFDELVKKSIKSYDTPDGEDE